MLLFRFSNTGVKFFAILEREEVTLCVDLDDLQELYPEVVEALQQNAVRLREMFCEAMDELRSEYLANREGDDFIIVFATNIIMWSVFFCCARNNDAMGIQNVTSTGQAGDNCSIIASLELLKNLPFLPNGFGPGEATDCIKKIYAFNSTDEGSKKAGMLVDGLRVKLNLPKDGPLAENAAFEAIIGLVPKWNAHFGDDTEYKMIKGVNLGRDDVCEGGQGAGFRPQRYLEKNKEYEIVGWIQGVNGEEYHDAWKNFAANGVNPLGLATVKRDHSITVLKKADAYVAVSNGKMMELRDLPTTLGKIDVVILKKK